MFSRGNKSSSRRNGSSSKNGSNSSNSSDHRDMCRDYQNRVSSVYLQENRMAGKTENQKLPFVTTPFSTRKSDTRNQSAGPLEEDQQQTAAAAGLTSNLTAAAPGWIQLKFQCTVNHKLTLIAGHMPYMPC